jgi:hypothetical protein
MDPMLKKGSGGDGCPRSVASQYFCSCFCFVVVSALDDWDAEPLADWSPVVVVDEVSADWLPVEDVAFTVEDWSPVVFALSIVRLERPRRSMFGVKVEVDPVTDEFASVEEPAMLLLVVELEPVTEGLAVALPLALVSESALSDELLEPNALPLDEAADDGAVDDVAAVESSMQSWCTALAEWSFAWPVDLSASLPAFGWLSSLHFGVLAEVVDDVCANAGAAPIRAETTRVVR